MTTTKNLEVPTAASDPDEDSSPVSEAQPAARSSVLSGLRAKRAAMNETLYVDLQVPRWTDPEIWVRFKPAEPASITTAMEKRRKRQPRPADWFVMAQCDVLAESCIGVYAILDDTKYSLRVGDEEGDWTKFDADLANNLGLDTQRAAEVVRGLYVTDGDLIGAMNKLALWSGITVPDMDEDFLDS
jgi:hypothetical protein